MKDRYICLFLALVYSIFPLAASRIDTAAWITRIDSVSRIALTQYEQEYYAIQLSKRSTKLKKQFFGIDSPEYLHSLLYLSGLYSDRDFSTIANKYHRLAYTPYMTKLRSEFCQLSESDRALYWKKASSYFDKTMYVAYGSAHRHRFNDGNEIAAAAYNAQLLSKGLLLNLSMDFEQYVMNSRVDSAIELLLLRKHYMDLGCQAEVDSLDYQILSALDSEGMGYHIEDLSTTWESIRQALGDNDLAIEFFEVDKSQYGALLLRKSWKRPKIVRLPSYYSLTKKRAITNLNISIGRKRRLENSIKIETALSNYNSEVKRDTVNNTWGEVVRYMVFPDALLQYFPNPGEGNIFFSAVGILHQTAIETIPLNSKKDENGVIQQTLMADVFNMVRLSSTRELVNYDNDVMIDSAVVYGGIEYNLTPNQIKTESEKYPNLRTRGEELDTINRGVALYLPQTRVEVDTISVILKKNHILVDIYADQKANEESFKSLSGKHENILHVATHGFAWEDSEARKKDYFMQKKSLEDYEHNSIDPLSRCGLLLAGANTAYSGNSAMLPDGVQDGVLTAKEISLLDLKSCNLVVLSACETAKGDVTSDGVFGLQRAFKMAGVQTIIMSLWKVDDLTTQMLMTEFYRNWIERHQTKREAFRNAQDFVRNYKDENGNYLYNKPYFWAGFVMLD